jgi:hypothetical protein
MFVFHLVSSGTSLDRGSDELTQRSQVRGVRRPVDYDRV